MVGHLPALRRYALGLTGDRHSADDLVQDCIERALRRMDTLVDEQRLAAWLRSILSGCAKSSPISWIMR